MRSTPPRRPSQPLALTRTSYQVGRPWMFDGKMLRGLTGMPMRRKLFAKSSFAEAEPEPLTLANLTTKSLSASMRFLVVVGVIALVLVGGVVLLDLARERIELELAKRRLVGEELFAHLVGRFADLRPGQAQLRRLRGELDLAGAVQAPEADEGRRDGLADGQQAVVAQDEGLVFAAQALHQARALVHPHRRAFEVVVREALPEVVRV